jgi:hypothetical protein
MLHCPCLWNVRIAIDWMLQREARCCFGAVVLARVGKAHMNTLNVCNSKSSESLPPRGALLRWVDTLAAWQMRHSHHVISRAQPADATISSVTQPSSANERSSTSPCDL